jgi:hypothetical protein
VQLRAQVSDDVLEFSNLRPELERGGACANSLSHTVARLNDSNNASIATLQCQETLNLTRQQMGGARVPTAAQHLLAQPLHFSTRRLQTFGSLTTPAKQLKRGLQL